MRAQRNAKKTAFQCGNTAQHGALTLEFVAHDDRTEPELVHRKKVQDLLTQMYIRAKKRGRPRLEEEQEAA